MKIGKALNRLAWGLSLCAAVYSGGLSLQISSLSRFDHGQSMNYAVAAIFAGGAFAMVWAAYGTLLLAVVKPSRWFVQVCTGVRDISISCPACGRRLRGATTKMLGETGVCPKCKAEFPISDQRTPAPGGQPKAPSRLAAAKLSDGRIIRLTDWGPEELVDGTWRPPTKPVTVAAHWEAKPLTAEEITALCSSPDRPSA